MTLSIGTVRWVQSLGTLVLSLGTVGRYGVRWCGTVGTANTVGTVHWVRWVRWTVR